MERTRHGDGWLAGWRLGKAGWWAVLKSTVGEFKEDRVMNLAALVTLRLVLALVPSLIAAVAITAQFTSPADIERFVASAQEFIPAQSREFVISTLGTIVDSDEGGSATIIGVLVGLFAATSAAAALVKALNTAFEVEEERNFIGRRLVSLGIVAALLVTLAGMFVVLVLGPSLVEFLLPRQVMESPVRHLITIGRYLAAMVLLILFFDVTFRVGPHRENSRWRPLTPGAVLGVGGWMLLSYLFSLYVRIAGDFAVYGAAAGVFILLIWLNYSFVVLLMGAELDHEIELHLMESCRPTSEAGVLDDDERHDGQAEEATASRRYY